jgi:hypothetical protein
MRLVNEVGHALTLESVNVSVNVKRYVSQSGWEGRRFDCLVVVTD